MSDGAPQLEECTFDMMEPGPAVYSLDGGGWLVLKERHGTIFVYEAPIAEGWSPEKCAEAMRGAAALLEKAGKAVGANTRVFRLRRAWPAGRSWAIPPKNGWRTVGVPYAAPSSWSTSAVEYREQPIHVVCAHEEAEGLRSVADRLEGKGWR